MKLQQSWTPSIGTCLLHRSGGIEEEIEEIHAHHSPPSRDNMWFHTSTMAVLRATRIPKQHWKVSTNLQTTTTCIKDWHEIVRIAKRVEQAIMMGKIEGSVMDSRTMIRDESKDNSEGGKLYLYGLATPHCSINYSNVFAKIDIPPPLKFVYQHLLCPDLSS